MNTIKGILNGHGFRKEWIITRATLAAGVVLLAWATESFAIEGLGISVQCPDVILAWPSNSNETYIVQWRPNLAPGTPWVTLTNSLPADPTTNWMVFGDSNRVQCGSSGQDSMTMMIDSGGADLADPSILDVMTAYAIRVSQPLVMRADGSGTPMPLGLYPPGTDLSGFIIIDPITGQSVSGAGYTVSQPSMNMAQSNDVQPQDDQGDDGTDSTNSPAADPGILPSGPGRPSFLRAYQWNGFERAGFVANRVWEH